MALPGRDELLVLPVSKTSLAHVHLLRVLADKPVRVVVTLGPGHKPEEITDIPANAHVEPLVSHSAVLERGGLLVAHAGGQQMDSANRRVAPVSLITSHQPRQRRYYVRARPGGQ